MAAASGRPTMSATPPGGNGTIMVIGLVGYCACAPKASSAKSAAKILFMTRFLLLECLQPRF